MHEPNKAFQIMGGICPGGTCPGGMCPRGYMSRGKCPGGKHPGGYMSGGKCPGLHMSGSFFVLSPYWFLTSLFSFLLLLVYRRAYHSKKKT